MITKKKGMIDVVHTKKLRQMLRTRIAKLTVEEIGALYTACAQASAGDAHSKALFAAYFGHADSLGDYVLVSGICYDLLPEEERARQDAIAEQQLEDIVNNPPILPGKILSGVAKLRAERGLTRGQLAEMSGVNARRIARYEDEPGYAGNMTLVTATKLAGALGVHAEDLI